MAMSSTDDASARRQYLTLPQAAALIQTPAETIRYWIWQGRLRAFKPGRTPLILETDLVAFVEAHEVNKLRAAKPRSVR
jgi:excisionase family DNA binding protein